VGVGVGVGNSNDGDGDAERLADGIVIFKRPSNPIAKSSKSHGPIKSPPLA
jgi:hypothetical protein